jgi:hypothetical protein
MSKEKKELNERTKNRVSRKTVEFDRFPGYWKEFCIIQIIEMLCVQVYTVYTKFSKFRVSVCGMMQCEVVLCFIHQLSRVPSK